jgi:exonuclease SbcC
MKITRIKGSNLASFKEFDLRLDSGLLADATIFAITGRTGAGKSTMLDAVCLALYGSLPRNEGVTSIDLDGGYQTGKAVSIVRRGQTSASAVCEFLADDHRRYRSEWSVRSVGRGDNKGKLQVEIPIVWEIDAAGNAIGAALTRNVKEHSAKVLELVGLSETEFRRAAMLAQGDFSAFLRANSKERADLLEKITGADQYSGIGRKVHELARLRESAVTECSKRVDRLIPWTPEQEAAANQTIAALKDALAAAQDQQKRVSEEQRLWKDLQARTVTLADTQAAMERALERQRKEEPNRLRGERADRAEPLRAARDKRQAAVDAVLAQHKNAKARAEELLGADAELRLATEKSLARKRDAEAARSRQTDARPDLERAEELDEQLRASAREVESANLGVNGQEQRVKDRAVALHRAKEELSGALRDQESCSSYLQARAGIATTLAAGDPAQHLRTLQDLEAYSAQRAAADQAAARAAVDAQAACTIAESALQRANEDLKTAKAELDALGPRPDPKADLEALLVAKGREERGVRVLDREHAWSEAQARVAPKVQRSGQIGPLLEGLAARLQQQVEAVTRAQGELAGAEKALSRARDRLSLDDRRRELVEGEACPLCGATEHPYGASSDSPALTAASELVQELKVALAQAEACVTETKAEHAALTAEQASLDAELPALLAALAVAADAAKVARTAWGGDSIPTKEQLVEAVRQAEHALNLATEAQRKWDSCDSTYRRAQTVAVDAAAALAPLGNAAAGLVAEAKKAADEAESAKKKAETSAGAARAALADWPEKLDFAQLTNAIAAVTSAVSAWRTKSKEQDELIARLPGLRAAQSTASMEHEDAAAELGRLQTRKAEAVATQTLRSASRAKLLDGKLVVDVKAELQRAVDDATEAATQAALSLGAADAKRKSADAEALRAQEMVAEAEVASGKAETALGQQLLTLGWTLEELDSNLMDYADRESIRTAVLAAKEQLEIAISERDNAQKEVDAIVIPEGFAPELLDARAAAAAGAVAEADSARTEGIAQVARGREEGRKRLEAEQELADLARAAAPWERLRALIGGERGEKFRALAQARSVDALVELANAQLKHFAGRYSLQRHPGSGMDLRVCDEGSGDEIRGTDSLSGGETFLVSLALALALGRLSSRSVNVQTLFIDEGFGSLDVDTVEPVIEALRRIASNGTQIGLISHVPVIAERVDVQVQVLKQNETSGIRVGRSR